MDQRASSVLIGKDDCGEWVVRSLPVGRISFPTCTGTQPEFEIDTRHAISLPRRRAGSGCVATPPRRRSSSARFERSRGHRSSAGSTSVQRRAADRLVQSACLWRLRELPEATSSRRCGDDAPSAASGYDRGSGRDETRPPPQRYGIFPSDIRCSSGIKS